MKAMLIKEYGENATFEVGEVEKPEVKSGHVLVKIVATSVNQLALRLIIGINDLK